MMLLPEEYSVFLSKPVTAGVIAGLVDRLYFQDRRMENNLYFGMAVAGGILAADYFTRNSKLTGVEENIDSRILQLSVASAATMGLDSYAFQKTRGPEVPQRIGCVVFSEVLGE